MTRSVVEVVGETVMDLVPGRLPGSYDAAPGGSPANVAVGLARLDVPTRLRARLADDPFGRVIRRHLESNAVDLSESVDAAEQTSLAVVSVGADGGPEYDFRVDGTADWQWTHAELADAPGDDALHLHTGSLAATTPPGAAAIADLVRRARRDVTVSYDPNCRPALMDPLARERIVELVALADVVKVSAEDLEWLAPGEAPDVVAGRWLDLGPSVVVVTHGSSGATAHGRGFGRVQVRGPAVDVVDTVGAGDSFMSALLAQLCRRRLLGQANRAALAAASTTDVGEVLTTAVAAASITCSRAGADPPTTAELDAVTS